MINPEIIKKISVGLAAAVAVVIVSTVIVSKVKDKAYKEFISKHDEETARSLAEAFNHRVDKLQKDSISRFKEDVRKLCEEYQIAYVC